jgi:hypothetical protein
MKTVRSKPEDDLRVEVRGDRFLVFNLTKDTDYYVWPEGGTLVCGCPARLKCKHIRAVEELMQLPKPMLQAVPDAPKFKPFARPISDILEDLARPIPQRLLATRKQGGATLTYIPWINVVRLLDYYAPGWEGSITHLHTTSDRIILTYRITIYAQEGAFSREATGTEVLKEVNPKTGEIRELAYGDPSSNSEGMAFRRAAAKFGLALHLYDKS